MIQQEMHWNENKRRYEYTLWSGDTLVVTVEPLKEGSRENLELHEMGWFDDTPQVVCKDDGALHHVIINALLGVFRVNIERYDGRIS